MPRFAWVAVLFVVAVMAAHSQESVPDTIRKMNAARTSWFQYGRIAHKGHSAAEFRLRAHHLRLQSAHLRSNSDQAEPLSASYSSTGWIPLGPAPLTSDASGFGVRDYGLVTGRVTSIAIDRTDISGNTVYVGAAYGGVWKSTNAAAPLPSDVIWRPLFDDQPTLAIGAIALKPGSSSIVLVGTGETNSSPDSYYGLGIFRSTDAGNSWTPITSTTDGHSFTGLGFSQIVFSTTNPLSVVAAAGAASQGSVAGLDSRTTRGIYVSSDAGQTWQTASVRDGGSNITSSSATSVAYDATAHKFFAAVRRHGIYSSIDGVNWSRLASQPGPASGPGALSSSACPPDAAANSYGCPIYRAQLAVVPGRDEVYLWYVDLPGNSGSAVDLGLWRSVNGGSWVQLTETGLSSCGDSSGCGAENGDYALTLSAVPNGASATDLYAGAVNLFKCPLSEGSASTSCRGGAWLNLTHGYGCSEIAKVHPNQHASDFLVAAGKAIGYFANDGGIYRTLDGYMGLTAGLNGSCSGSNQFEGLNETMGSLTQLVSFAQHPTDVGTLLAGAQGNGFPATNQAMSSSSFVNVHSGDGGYTGIVPSAPTRWLASAGDLPPGGLNIGACDSGVDCRTGNFSTLLSSVDLGGDDGAYYVPFSFDSATDRQLLIGTCRVWRAATDGSSITQLSNNFDAGSGSCSGNEVNLIRALATGGPKGDHGFSNVVYATTNGEGPILSAVNPAGGRIFVSTDADTATPMFRDKTGALNPEQYPLSDVAIDPSDGSGQTAFVTVMGFGVTHIFKTVNAGASWTPFGNPLNGLPDIPINAVVVDGEAAQVYVGTDSGVFVSSTAMPLWSEVGPASGIGHLPDVPVTMLQWFNPDAKNKRLRVSTYGRGIWEYVLAAAPDFRLTFHPNTLTVFAGQPANFGGTLTGSYGYTSEVSLGCADAVDLTTCIPSPAQAFPSADGASINVTATASPGIYPFKIHALGSDTGATTHDASLTLDVIDFGLSSVSPSNVSATKPGTSTPATLVVTASGPFEKTVTLKCLDGLPSGSTCMFSPSASVTPSQTSPVNVTLTIAITSSTPTGKFPITIQADVAGAPAPKQKFLTLTVMSTPDFQLAVNPSTISVLAGQSGEFVGTLTSLNGYVNSVDISCGTGAPPTCTGGSFLPSAAGTEFRVKVGSTTAQTFNFNLVGRGTDPADTQHSIPVTMNSAGNFSISSDSDTQAIPAGGTAIFSLVLTPEGGPFNNSVVLTCSSLPTLSRCIFQPAAVSTGSGATTVRLDVATTAPTATLASSVRFLYALFVPILMCAGTVRIFRRSPKSAILTFLFFSLALLPSCGGGLSEPGTGGGPGTPPGTYSIRISAVSGTVSQQTTVTVIVQ